MRKVSIAVLVCLFTAAVCLADANVEQKTQVHFGGFMGGIINVFGGKSTHEGLTSNTFVKGHRRLTTHGDSGEIVDLSEEKIYQLDLNRKTYKVVTFDELRKQFEEQKKNAEKERDRNKSAKNQEGPEYEVDFDVKDTGQKQVINGYNTHEVIVTVAAHEKGKKLEQAGGVVMTSDMWMGPKIAAMNDLASFDRRYFEKLYGSMFGAAEMSQMAVLMATNPAFAKAMKTFSAKRASLDGTPIRTLLTVETVPNPQQQASEDSGPPLSASRAIGGLFKKAQQRRQENKGEPANRSKLMESTVELLKASSTVSSSDVALPSGFRER